MNNFLNILAEYQLAVGGAGGTEAAPALRAAAAGEVFGPMSHRVAADAAAVADTAGGFASTTAFHAAALLLLVCYMLVLYRHPELFRTLREHIFSAGTGQNKHLNENRNDPLRNFSWGVLLLDVLFFCTVAVRVADATAPGAASSLPAAVSMAAVPFAAALFLAIAAYQLVLLAVSGAITVSRPLTSALTYVKVLYYRLCTVTLTPVLLLWVLLPATGGRAFEIILVVMLAAMLAAFLRETFLLFISKKLSIYHWFLYLCTVEAFPLSLICLLAVRG